MITTGQTTGQAVNHPPSYRWIGVTALIAAAVAFSVYPVMRGFGSEAGLLGATLYARPAWLAAHCLGMVGFVLTAIGLRRIDEWAHRLAWAAAIGVLPYYGAEAFGLHALGTVALRNRDAGMIAAADGFRYQPVAMIIFGAGLILLALAGVRLLLLIRRPARIVDRSGLALTGLALLSYLPQFFAGIELRIVHGAVLAVGLLLLAASAPRWGDAGGTNATADEVTHADTRQEGAQL